MVTWLAQGSPQQPSPNFVSSALCAHWLGAKTLGEQKEGPRNQPVVVQSTKQLPNTTPQPVKKRPTTKTTMGFLRPPRLILITAALVLWVALGLASAAELTCLATGTGDWHTPTTWTNCNSGVPGENDTAIISGSSAHVTIDGEAYTTALTVTAGATLTSQGPASSLPLPLVIRASGVVGRCLASLTFSVLVGHLVFLATIELVVDDGATLHSRVQATLDVGSNLSCSQANITVENDFVLSIGSLLRPLVVVIVVGGLVCANRPPTPH
jgi:hypothetical protein